MKCPACGKDLEEVSAGDIQIDICRSGCGGVWFDKDEIKKFDEPHEFMAEAILQGKPAAEARAGSAPRPCPRCPGEVLVRQFADVKNSLQIDQCWQCSGIWLDPGELAALRGQYRTAVDRAQAVNSYVESHLAEEEKEMAAEGSRRISHYNEETRNVFTSFLYGFKRLLGAELDEI